MAGGDAFVFGFVGRVDAPAEEGKGRDGGGETMWASYGAAPALLEGLRHTASEVLAKHRGDAAGTYCTRLDGGGSCYTKVKIVCPPPIVPSSFAMHDATPLPSQAAREWSSPGTLRQTEGRDPGGSNQTSRASGRSNQPPSSLPLPRVVYGVIVRGDARDGPTPDECERWLDALGEMFEREHGVGAYGAPRGATFDAFARRIKDHAPHLERKGPVAGKIQEVKDKMSEVRVVMVNNIARVIDRGERLDDVLVKSDSLASTAQLFKRTATRLRNRMWWQNVKMWIALGAVLLVVVFAVFLAACRGVACIL